MDTGIYLCIRSIYTAHSTTLVIMLRDVLFEAQSVRVGSQAALKESLSLLALTCILLDIKLETMTKLKPRVMYTVQCTVYTFLCGAKLRFIWCDKGDAALDVTVTLTSCQCCWHSAPKGL